MMKWIATCGAVVAWVGLLMVFIIPGDLAVAAMFPAGLTVWFVAAMLRRPD